MSILRHFNKHHGYDVHGKRTPFGGGGGWNPVSAISDAVSSVSDALAQVDPGPAIGSGLAQVDQAVNQIPGGWYTVGGLAAGGTALAFAPEIAAAAGIDAGTTIATEAGQQAFFDALASGASSTEAINAGLAVEAAAAPLATDLGIGTDATLQGPTYQELGVTGVPEGGMGPTYGELGYTGLNNAEAIAAADAASQGLSASDLANANRLKNIAKLLTGNETGFAGKTMPTANQWTQKAAQNFAQVTPEQFGGLYEMNKNPFTFQNPLAKALKKNAPEDIYDVSGESGQALNTKSQALNLAKLLA